MNILLIEDNEVIRKGLVAELEKVGHTLSAIENADPVGADDFNLDRFDRVIADCDRPDFSGLHVIDVNKRLPQPVPCLVHSWQEPEFDLESGTCNVKELAAQYPWLKYAQRRIGRNLYLWKFIEE